MSDEPVKKSDIPEDQGLIRDELGRFPKGVSGNPGGRPKGPSPVTRLRELLSKDGGTSIAKALISEARGGNVRAIQEIINRMDGPVPSILKAEQHHSFDEVVLEAPEDQVPEAILERGRNGNNGNGRPH